MSDTPADESPPSTAQSANQDLALPGAEWGTDLRDTATSVGPEVAGRHLRFSAAQCDEIYVVGDVHGCIDELRTLWGELSPTEDDVVVFVGDLIRKGPDSTAAVEFVADRPNAVSVLGNNEAKILHDRIDTDPFEPIRDEIESFPLVVSWDDAMAVHGGVHPDRPLADHDADDLLETRSVPPENGYDGPFWFDLYEGPPRVFFGHSVLAEPRVGDWAVGLDTGCVYGGELTAYDYRRDELLSVPAERTYQQRDQSEIIDPR